LAFALFATAVLAVPAPLATGPAWSPFADEPQNQAPLTRVSQIRGLTALQAAQARPVHLIGVVTALSGFKDSLFLEDATGGIDVDRNRSAMVKIGDLVDLTGVTNPGHFAPTVMADEVRVLGPGRLPEPRRVSFAEMMGGEQDSQWIEVEGIVHSSHKDRVYGYQMLVLSVDVGGGTMRVLLQHFDPADETGLIDATLRFRGVCISDFNEKRQFVGLGLIVPSRDDIKILQPSAPDPFAAPTTPIHDALQFGHSRHRVKIEGVSTYQVPGHFIYLQQGDDGIRVRTTSTQIVPPGTRVEAVGFPASGDYAPVLVDGFFRVLGPAQPVVPLAIDAAKVITKPGEFTHVEHDEQLVEIEGEVVESRSERGERVWTLRQDGRVFDAYLSTVGIDKRAERRIEDLGPGSLLRLVGLCAVRVDYDRNPTSFDILLRSPADIVVLRGTSWWNTKHLIALLSALAAVVLAGTLWVTLLRLRVAQLTRSVVESEKRFRYLATHDALTGLESRASILAALEEGLRAASNGGTGVCVAILDLDHFKRINDTYGHPAGDAVLREAARRLTAAIRETDAVGRYGGEEFLIVFRNLPADVGGQAIGIDRCEVVRRAMCGQPVDCDGMEVAISCSIGVARAGRNCEVAADRLIAQADEALYKAKRGGRNRVVCFGAESAPAERLDYASAER
jgi:diguanylate cyclase (GGDEF)-like protein